MVHITFKKRILNITKICHHFALVFKIHEIKVIINTIKYSPEDHDKNTVDKYL